MKKRIMLVRTTVIVSTYEVAADDVYEASQLVKDMRDHGPKDVRDQALRRLVSHARREQESQESAFVLLDEDGKPLLVPEDSNPSGLM